MIIYIQHQHYIKSLLIRLFKITLQKSPFLTRYLTNNFSSLFSIFYPIQLHNVFRTSVYYRSDKILYISTSMMCTNRKIERKNMILLMYFVQIAFIAWPDVSEGRQAAIQILREDVGNGFPMLSGTERVRAYESVCG